MTHIMKIDEMARFGRRTEHIADALDFVEEFSDILGDVLEGINEGIKNSGLVILTKRDLQDEDLHFDIKDWFSDINGIIGTDRGEYCDKSTSIVAISGDEDISRLLWVYALIPFTFDTNGVIDYAKLEKNFVNTDILRNNVYAALRKIRTDIFDGRLWNNNDFTDGDFITIPLKLRVDANAIKEGYAKTMFDLEYTEDITKTLSEIVKALKPVLDKYRK